MESFPDNPPFISISLASAVYENVNRIESFSRISGWDGFRKRTESEAVSNPIYYSMEKIYSPTGNEPVEPAFSPTDGCYMDMNKTRFCPSDILLTSYRELLQCGFYFGKMTLDDVRNRLRNSEPGTFLLRDSSDSNFQFSLSIQTHRGATSIRIRLRPTVYSLESTPDDIGKNRDAVTARLPAFSSVLGLIEYYVTLSSSREGLVFVESNGRRDTPVFLKRALCKASRPSEAPLPARHQSLSEGCNASDRLCLLPSLKTYLLDYKHAI